jgi:two-component system, NtrC family, response regulator AtoC
MNKTILIIDDKVKLCKTLVQTFGHIGYQALYATHGSEALKCLSHNHIQAILLDIKLGEENGIDLLRQIRAFHQHIPIIMMTGYASVDTAVQSLKLGACDYVRKPLDFEQLVNVVENALKLHRQPLSSRQQHSPVTSQSVKPQAPHIVTRHPQMLKVCDKARRLAATDLPILLLGENGTGKEVLADFIHSQSARKSHAMLKINCAAFPESLLDNELFGHEKGAYTGADTEFKGVFERANHSSLFLDEIGDMSLTIQAKILRTLHNRELRRLGGSRTIQVDVRFIAATNKDLQKLIDRERFRQDLYYRLKAAVLKIPPLRERKDDIPLLVNHFLAEYARLHSEPEKIVKKPVWEVLTRYDWPGNVRELKNLVNYAAAISANDTIGLDDLPPDFLETPPVIESNGSLEDVEKNVILNMLRQTGYNKKRTAELLNIGRKTLYRKLRKYGISTPK